MHVCRLHKVLAAERGFAGCTGAAGAPAAEAEAAAMSGALESAFLAMDREILDRARHESGRDGCCALVAVRIGAVPLPDPPVTVRRLFASALLSCMGRRERCQSEGIGLSSSADAEKDIDWCAGDYLWTAHVGDCRAVLSRGGRSLPLTEGTPHSFNLAPYVCRSPHEWAVSLPLSACPEPTHICRQPSHGNLRHMRRYTCRFDMIAS